jgi:ribosome-binding factor A
VPYRVEKFSSTLKHCLADILLNESDNPHFKSISISDVIVSSDLKKAKIFVYSSRLKSDDLTAKLTAARGFIKKSLAKKMHLKYMPELYFVKNDTCEKQDEKESC